jgi:hypothetical protein
LAYSRETETNHVGMSEEAYVHRALYIDLKDAWGFFYLLDVKKRKKRP